MENITVVSQRSHDHWNLEMKGGSAGGEGSREGKGERRGGGGGGGGWGGWGRKGRGERGGCRPRRGRGTGLSYLGPWTEPWALKFSYARSVDRSTGLKVWPDSGLRFYFSGLGRA